MSKILFLLLQFLLLQITISAQYYGEVRAIAADSTISEIDPYLTHYWYSGQNNCHLEKGESDIGPLWLTFVETDYDGFSDIAAYNFKYDYNNNSLSEKYTISDTTNGIVNRNPIIENYLGKPVGIWEGTDSQQTDLYYSVFSDSLWSEPQKITDDTLVESSKLFFTVDHWDLSEQTDENNYLFWISENIIKHKTLSHDFIWGPVDTLYSSDSLISDLKLSKNAFGDIWLIYKEKNGADSTNINALIQLRDDSLWIGPLNLMQLNSPNPKISFDAIDGNKFYILWTKELCFRDTIITYENDSLRFYDWYMDGNSCFTNQFDFTSNTLILGGCIIDLWPYFLYTETTDSLNFINISQSTMYPTDYYEAIRETPNRIDQLSLSGFVYENFLAAWTEFDGKQYDIYLYPGYITWGDVDPLKENLDFILEQNYPNPFNPSTKIRYSIPSTKISDVLITIKVYDILGREVTTLVNEQQVPGNYEVIFNASGLSSGTYFYQLVATNRSGITLKANKMLLLK